MTRFLDLQSKGKYLLNAPEVWVIIVLAISMRIYGVNNLFPSVDELLSMRRAINMVWGDLNPHSFTYPSGYYYFLLGVQVITFLFGIYKYQWTTPTDIFIANLQDPMNLAPAFRIAGIIASTIAILITYLSAKKLVGRKYAWISALFLAISPFASYWSTQIRPEALIILPASIVLFFGIRYSETGKIEHTIISGLAVGAAVSIKYNAIYLSVIIPFAIYEYQRFIKISRVDIAWKHLLISALASLGGFFVLTPFSILDWPTFLNTFVYFLKDYREIAWAGLGLDAIYHQQQVTPWLWWFQVLNGISPGLFWVILTSAALILIKWRSQYLLITGPTLFMLLFLTWFGRSNDYHLIPILPILGCLLAIAVRDAVSLIPKYQSFVLVALFLFCLLGINENYARLSDLVLPDTRIEARNWIEEHIPEGTKIILDKFYVPHLVHSKEQIEYLTNHPEINIDYSVLEIGLQKTKTYWTENIPIAVNSMSYGMTEDGLVIQPELPTPGQYAVLGFEYIILSDYVYSRFWADDRYLDIKAYYESFLNGCEIVHEIDNGIGRPGPKLTIIKLDEYCAN